VRASSLVFSPAARPANNRRARPVDPATRGLGAPPLGGDGGDETHARHDADDDRGAAQRPIRRSRQNSGTCSWAQRRGATPPSSSTCSFRSTRRILTRSEAGRAGAVLHIPARSTADRRSGPDILRESTVGRSAVGRKSLGAWWEIAWPGAQGNLSAQPMIPAREALARLREGNRRFVGKRSSFRVAVPGPGQQPFRESCSGCSDFPRSVRAHLWTGLRRPCSSSASPAKHRRAVGQVWGASSFAAEVFGNAGLAFRSWATPQLRARWLPRCKSSASRRVHESPNLRAISQFASRPAVEPLARDPPSRRIPAALAAEATLCKTSGLLLAHLPTTGRRCSSGEIEPRWPVDRGERSTVWEDGTVGVFRRLIDNQESFSILAP